MEVEGELSGWFCIPDSDCPVGLENIFLYISFSNKLNFFISLKILNNLSLIYFYMYNFKIIKQITLHIKQEQRILHLVLTIFNDEITVFIKIYLHCVFISFRKPNVIGQKVDMWFQNWHFIIQWNAQPFNKAICWTYFWTSWNLTTKLKFWNIDTKNNIQLWPSWEVNIHNH